MADNTLASEAELRNNAVAHFRRFNRFYTTLLGLLNRGLLDSSLGLSEVRVLYEIASAPGVSAVELTRILEMDRGQLSRILAKLRKNGLINRQEERSGRRPVPLSLTAQGGEILNALQEASNKQAAGLLQHLDARGIARFRASLSEIEQMLQQSDAPRPAVHLREARSGDMGWVIMRHGEYYGHTCGFGLDFEGYVLLGLAEYLQRPKTRSRLWIAERAGEPLGSVAIVEQPDNQAQMRWLLVEPHARGLGVGKMLVGNAVNFAKEQGYDRIYLWTISTLLPARSLYAASGFTQTGQKPGDMGGCPVTEECWELALGSIS